MREVIVMSASDIPQGFCHGRKIGLVGFAASRTVTGRREGSARTTRAGRRTILGIASLAIFVAAAPAGAEWFRLSQGQAFSDIAEYRVSPDGRRAVYLQDAETDGVPELWSVALPSGAPVRLSRSLPAGPVLGFGISPDSARVVYRAEQDAAGVSELYSVPIEGPSAARVKLSPALVAGGDVSEFAISPDGARVVYRADQETDEVRELYSVPIAGPAAAGVKLNGALVPGGDVGDYVASPNGARVVYRADQETDEAFELYSVPIAGPAAVGVKLNGPLVAGGSVSEGAAFSPNSARVVYRADQQTDGVVELYSAPSTGPASAGVRLNPTLVPGGHVWAFELSPNSARVVYRAEQEIDDVFELYSVPIAGPASAGVKLNTAPVAGGDVSSGFVISPNGARVLYRSDQETDGVLELYSVPIAGPASSGVKLNGPLVAGGDVEVFAISPDSVWAVYAADQELDGWPMGYRAPLAGPAGADERIWATAVNNPSDFAILPDSSTVAVRGNSAFIDGIVRLWTYPLAGTPDWEGTDWLGDEFQPNGDATSFVLLPDGSGAVYRADQEVDNQLELYLLYFRLWGDGFETGDTDRWSATVP
jgi:Tol biopolymer transport system component